MRKLLKRMAKAEMNRLGYSKVNKRMSRGRWREVLKIVPTEAKTGKKLGYGFRRKAASSLSSPIPPIDILKRSAKK